MRVLLIALIWLIISFIIFLLPASKGVNILNLKENLNKFKDSCNYNYYKIIVTMVTILIWIILFPLSIIFFIFSIFYNINKMLKDIDTLED